MTVGPQQPGQTSLTLIDVLAAQHASGTANNDRSVILLWLYGGPSQLETYDLKPLAPSEYRSVFSSIATNRRLARQLDRYQASLDLRGNMGAAEKFREQAFDLLANPRIATAFDLEQEDAAVRERYGRHRWGSSCLQALRLAEAGSSVVTVVFDTPDDSEQFTNWDDHGANAGRPGHFANYVRVRLPYMDQALSALIEDIYARGLGKQIMLVVMGEFGRTPRISYYPPKDAHGRDHWPDAYTALVSGGGLRMGQIVGATNAKAEHPTERPYTPQDVLATIYRHLGIDYTLTLADFFGRPVHILSDARPIAELS